MVYSALEIAKYKIYREYNNGHIISNLKLQKVLYFIQAEFLVVNNCPCFKEDIVATDFGPVVLEVFHKYAVYGGSGIPYLKKDEFFLIGKDDLEMIDRVIDELRGYGASTLTLITLRQTPWKKSYVRSRKKTISCKLIKKYFEED